MKSLDEPYRDLMYMQRKSNMFNFDDLAAYLNCEKQHMVNAQIGKEIPDEVHSALINWLES